MTNQNIHQTYNQQQQQYQQQPYQQGQQQQQQQQQYQQRDKRSPKPQINYQTGSKHIGDANNYNQNNQDRRQSRTRDTLE